MRSSNDSDPRRYVSAAAHPVKIVVLGPFAVGKTTLIGAVSEIRPMRTEERLTEAGALVDDLAGIREKTTTTVAMDFGRLSLTEDIVLYLFGAPGQPRFSRTIASLLNGALGGLVMVDLRRLDQSFDSLNLLESIRPPVPFAVAVNEFEDSSKYSDDEIREALRLGEDRPLVRIDARSSASATRALIALVTDILNRPRHPEPAR